MSCNGKRRRKVAAAKGFLRPSSGVIDCCTAAKPPLKFCAVFADIVQHPGKARLVGGTEQRAEFSRNCGCAGQMFINGLNSAILDNMGKILHSTHLENCCISLIK